MRGCDGGATSDSSAHTCRSCGCAARRVVHVCWARLGWVDGVIGAFQNSLLHTRSTGTVHKRAPLCFPNPPCRGAFGETEKQQQGGRMPDLPASTNHSLFLTHGSEGFCTHCLIFSQDQTRNSWKKITNTLLRTTRVWFAPDTSKATELRCSLLFHGDQPPGPTAPSRRLCVPDALKPAAA